MKGNAHRTIDGRMLPLELGVHRDDRRLLRGRFLGRSTLTGRSTEQLSRVHKDPETDCYSSSAIRRDHRISPKRPWPKQTPPNALSASTLWLCMFSWMKPCRRKSDCWREAPRTISSPVSLAPIRRTGISPAEWCCSGRTLRRHSPGQISPAWRKRSSGRRSRFPSVPSMTHSRPRTSKSTPAKRSREHSSRPLERYLWKSIWPFREGLPQPPTQRYVIVPPPCSRPPALDWKRAPRSWIA